MNEHVRSVTGEIRSPGSPDELILLPGVAMALSQLAQTPFTLVIVTNQPGIAKGHFSEQDLKAVHESLLSRIRGTGARIDALYYCPHHPTEGSNSFVQACDCRKPLPGLLLKAAAELGIDLSESFMVGDSAKDIQAGRAAGCASILLAPPNVSADGADHIFADFPAFVRWIDGGIRHG